MAINVFVKGGGATLEEITATIDKVLSGYTYNDSEGEIQTGTMTNKGAVTGSVGVGGTYTNTGGYYSSISVTGPTLSGNATTAQVLKGQTFYSSNGTKQTGTLATRTPSATTVPNGGSVTGSAGYYAAFTIKATYAVQRVTKAMNGYWANSGVVASGYWGASAAKASTSFKVVSSGGYIWHSRNQGSNCNLYITRVYTY